MKVREQRGTSRANPKPRRPSRQCAPLAGEPSSGQQIPRGRQGTAHIASVSPQPYRTDCRPPSVAAPKEDGSATDAAKKRKKKTADTEIFMVILRTAKIAREGGMSSGGCLFFLRVVFCFPCELRGKTTGDCGEGRRTTRNAKSFKRARPAKGARADLRPSFVEPLRHVSKYLKLVLPSPARRQQLCHCIFVSSVPYATLVIRSHSHSHPSF
jgi:hypothetical protein